MRIRALGTLKHILGLVVPTALHAQAAEPLYMIYMNPFEVQKHEQAAIISGYVRPKIPITIKPEEQANYILRNLDEFNYSPGVEIVKSEIIKEASLSKVEKNSHAIAGFFRPS